VRIEVRSGGPATGFELVSAQLYKDKDITLGQVNTDEAVRFSASQPTLAVAAPMEISPFMIMWDPQAYPQFNNIADIGQSDAKVFYVEGDTYMEYLIGSGALHRSQVDGSYDGSPANFVGQDGKAAQAGFATSEPYLYEHEINGWRKPVKYALVNDTGYPFYPQALSIRPADKERLAPCLEKLVPIVQRAQIDFLKNPEKTNQFIIDTVKAYNTDWTYSEGLANYAIQKMREDFVNNGSDGALGNFERPRCSASSTSSPHPGRPAAGPQGGAEARGHRHQRVHRHRHRSHLMSVPPKIAPSLRADRIPLEQVPVVDFEPFRRGGEEDRKRTALELAGAFRNVGFAYLAGHGVDQDLVDRTSPRPPPSSRCRASARPRCPSSGPPATAAGSTWAWRTSTPTSRRRATSRRASGSATTWRPTIRWSARGSRSTGRTKWPTGVPGFRATMEEYFGAVHALARQVTHAVAVALELPEDYFDAWFTTPMVIMSPLHYPPQAASSGQQVDESRIGAGAHSDYGCLALLAQDDKGGLQVRNTAGRWIDARPIPGTFVVNVGDMLARWTNDLFPATLHRVINTSGVDRYSIPFFYDPNHDAPVEVIPTCLAEGEQPRYAPTTSLAHVQERFGATLPYLDGGLVDADKRS
jgi:isopenicillin N synthase-like dioxygenase